VCCAKKNLATLLPTVISHTDASRYLVQAFIKYIKLIEIYEIKLVEFYETPFCLSSARKIADKSFSTVTNTKGKFFFPKLSTIFY
jgi:hypothetical protein